MSRMPRVVRWAEEHAYKAQIDAIVACGHSGLVIAGALSYVTRIPVFAVRKKNEPRVAYNTGEVTGIAPNGKAKNWLWLDDLISSGGTLRHAAQMVWEAGIVELPYPRLILEYNVPQAAVDDGVNTVEDRLMLPKAVPGYNWRTAPTAIETFGFDE